MPSDPAPHEDAALDALLQFPFVDALFGRRSRRFLRGAEIPDGPLAFRSEEAPLGLSDTERLIRKLSDTRIHIPPREPYMEGHNSWVANRPGSLLAFPVGDVAQHAIANLCFFAQNGFTVFDDVHGRKLPGIEQFADVADVE